MKVPVKLDQLDMNEYHQHTGRYRLEDLVNLKDIEEVLNYLRDTKADKEHKKLLKAYDQFLGLAHELEEYDFKFPY